MEATTDFVLPKRTFLIGKKVNKCIIVRGSFMDRIKNGITWEEGKIIELDVEEITKFFNAVHSNDYSPAFVADLLVKFTDIVDIIKVVEYKKNGAMCYWWDRGRKLWKLNQVEPVLEHPEMVQETLKYMIKETLKIISEIRERINTMAESQEFTNDDREALKNQFTGYFNGWQKLYKSIQQVRPFEDIIKKLKGFLVDEDFNKNFEKLPVGVLPIANGQFIDLKTYRLGERTIKHYFTEELDIEINPENQEWKESFFRNIVKVKKFFDDIMLGDEEMITYLQRSIGAILTGEHLRRFFILYGSRGCNGKSTLMKILKSVLGKYFAVGSSAILSDTMAKSIAGDKPNSEIAKLKGCKITMVEEFDPDLEINPTLIKAYTGGEVSARKLHSNASVEGMTVPPIFLLCNNLPRLPKKKYLTDKDKVDLAYQDRLIVINFDAHFVHNPTASHERKLDLSFDETMRNDKGFTEAFALYAIKGAYDFYQNGGVNMEFPDKVKMSVSRYMEDETTTIELDFFTELMDDNIRGITINDEKGNRLSEKNKVLATDLYEVYGYFCDQNKQDALGKTKFGTYLRNNGLRPKKISDHYYLGLALEKVTTDIKGKLKKIPPQEEEAKE